MSNLKQWKTTLIGLISYAIAFYYFAEVNIWSFIVLLIFGTMMCFSADSFIKTLGTSIRNFLRSNSDKKI